MGPVAKKRQAITHDCANSLQMASVRKCARACFFGGLLGGEFTMGFLGDREPRGGQPVYSIWLVPGRNARPSDAMGVNRMCRRIGEAVAPFAGKIFRGRKGVYRIQFAERPEAIKRWRDGRAGAANLFKEPPPGYDPE